MTDIDLDQLYEHFETLTMLDDSEYEPFAAFLVNEHSNPAEATDDDVDRFRDAYRGTYGSIVDWAYEFIDDVYDPPTLMGNLQYYFDYEKFARDAVYSGDIYTLTLSNYDVAVFNS